jgi:outer membrane protein OmpA-like peptidoglycan-associated protein
MNERGRAIAILAAGLLVPTVLVGAWLNAAEKRLKVAGAEAQDVVIASASEDEYCTPALKQILRRVAGACGLLEGTGRGCQPQDAKTVAALSGDDFNALFRPLSHRVGIVQFDAEETELDDAAKAAVEAAWSDQLGASFFFVVARASADGDAVVNQQLSQQRAEAVLGHLELRFQDPDLKKEVGLMWLGEEFAQLGEEFCQWKRSRQDAECTIKDINRSAFVAWIDCVI